MSLAIADPKGASEESLRPLLENGMRLTTDEFLRRGEAMPELKKAELIDGVVFIDMFPLSLGHSGPDGLLHYWLGHFAVHTPGLEFHPNTTYVIGEDRAPQPDCILCSKPRPGGRVWKTKDGYLAGAPELVCEVAASSVAIDLREKFRTYQRAGVSEYLVWIVEQQEARWFALESGEYVALPEREGIITSRIFPKLALDVDALRRGDGAKLLAALQKHLAR